MQRHVASRGSAPMSLTSPVLHPVPTTHTSYNSRSLIHPHPRHAASQPPRRVSCLRAAAHEEGSSAPSSRPLPNTLSAVRELRDNTKWSQATVLRNESATLDGNTRLIHLSVSDHVDLLYGRKVKGVVDTKRWVDTYSLPGQFVGLRLPVPGGGAGEWRTAHRLYNLASSPYESHRDSAYIDGSIIQIVADRNGCEDDQLLASLGPGALVEVTQVVGRGFTSLFNSVKNVLSAVEGGKPMLLVALGKRGIAPLRALLNWTPILAHATKHSVTCLYMTRSASTAAFLPGWDLWREAGVDFIPVYSEIYEPESNETEALELLDKAMFLREGGFSSLVGNPSEVMVLLAGSSGDMASQLSKRLHAKGVPHEHMLFCDYF